MKQTFYVETTVYVTIEVESLDEAISWATSHTVHDMLAMGGTTGSVRILDPDSDVAAEV